MNDYLIGIGVVVIIIALILAYRYFRDQHNGKEEAKRFLKDLEEQMYLIIVECVNSLDFKDFQNFEEFEKKVLEIVYQGCWEFVDKKIAESESEDLLSAIAKKVLTREYVERFIKEVLVNREVEETIRNVYGVEAIEAMSEIPDTTVQEEFSDDSQYYVSGECETEDLPPAEEVVHTEEEEAALNPQTDEGDDLEEAVEEVTDRIIKITNKAGKNMYYLESGATGKRKQVSKQYAIECGLEIVDKY